MEFFFGFLQKLVQKRTFTKRRFLALRSHFGFAAATYAT